MKVFNHKETEFIMINIPEILVANGTGAFLASTSRNFYTSIQKTSRCAVTTGILYDSFNACTILLTLSM